eukprot:16089-Heterococcus_DN1.PRE.1
MLQAVHHTTHNDQDAHKAQHARVIIKAVLRDGKATDQTPPFSNMQQHLATEVHSRDIVELSPTTCLGTTELLWVVLIAITVCRTRIVAQQQHFSL